MPLLSPLLYCFCFPARPCFWGSALLLDGRRLQLTLRRKHRSLACFLGWMHFPLTSASSIVITPHPRSAFTAVWLILLLLPCASGGGAPAHFVSPFGSLSAYACTPTQQQQQRTTTATNNNKTTAQDGKLILWDALTSVKLSIVGLRYVRTHPTRVCSFVLWLAFAHITSGQSRTERNGTEQKQKQAVHTNRAGQRVVRTGRNDRPTEMKKPHKKLPGKWEKKARATHTPATLNPTQPATTPSVPFPALPCSALSCPVPSCMLMHAHMHSH